MGIEITMTIITALIGGAVSFFFVLLNKKLDTIKTEQNEHHEEIHLNNIADRELLLSTAKVTELVARKFDGEGINGELSKATKELQDKQDAMIDIMKKGYYEHMSEIRG